jgi:hypothetical protein
VSNSGIVDAARYALAAYCLILAVAAVLDRNRFRFMLIYPGRVIYSTLRLVLLIVTFGQVRLLPLAKRTQRSSARKWRTFKANRQRETDSDDDEDYGWASAEPASSVTPVVSFEDDEDQGSSDRSSAIGELFDSGRPVFD